VKSSLTLLAITLALALAGCGGGTVIDPEAAEEDIRAGFATRDITVTSVDCPSDVDAEKGGTYECEAETSEGDFRVIYRQLDDDGSVSQPVLEPIGEGAEAP
jgi:uncharacterized protein DUF4333